MLAKVLRSAIRTAACLSALKMGSCGPRWWREAVRAKGRTEPEALALLVKAMELHLKQGSPGKHGVKKTWGQVCS